MVAARFPLLVILSILYLPFLAQSGMYICLLLSDANADRFWIAFQPPTAV